MSKLTGKKAVVTGGNSGIGYATAKELKAQGAEVIITGRNAEKVDKAAKELGVIGLVGDQGKVGAIQELAKSVEEKFSKIDILFNNAGVFLGTPIGNIDESVYDDMMDINFKGVIFTVEAFNDLLNDGSSIINLSSVNAYSGMPGASVYSASKAALNAYTRAAAIELAGRKIRVNSVNPGPIETAIFGKSGMSEEQMNGFAETIGGAVPLKRFGKSEEVAKLVAFIASDDASYMTGGEYNVDGGISVHTIV